MTAKYYYSFILLFHSLLFYPVDCIPRILYEGSACTLSTGAKGVCTLFNKCKPAVRNFQRGIEPVVCGFSGRDVIVCCKDTRYFFHKSEEACRSYSDDVPLRVNPLIVGGSAAEVGEFPHMAALGYVRKRSKTVSWDCGGTLISNRYVLTAAHCSGDKSRQLRKVRLGGVNLDARNDVSQEYLVEKVIKHPHYQGNYNDIALVRLASTVRFSNNIMPACLYTQPTAPETGLLITGWGATDVLGDNKSQILMKATVQSMTLEKCNETYGRSGFTLRSGVNRDMICGYDPENNMDTCAGDSGGPLQVLDGDLRSVYSVVGVTSLGPAVCGGSTPAIYTKVSSYVPWIESIVWPAEDNVKSIFTK